MSERSQRRLTTIVAADIAGFSRLVGIDEEATLAAQRGHRSELIEPLLAEHNGRVANTAGDSFLFEFSSTVEAVRCAMAVQDGMARRNTDTPVDRRIEYRIGINLGDVISDGDDLLGDGVNVAARIEALAEPGGICLSRAARDQVRDRMEIGLEDMGAVEVKNIARPVRVFRVRAEGEDAPKRPTAKPWLKYAATAVIVLAIVAGGVAWWWWQQPDFEPADQSKMAYALPDKPSIAILPFEYLGADKEENGYLADGISQNVVGALGYLSEILVIDWQTSMSLKGKSSDIRKVAEEFGVQYVLKGSVQKSGDRLRVAAQLADAISGHQLWSKTFDNDLEQFFKIQDDVAKEILAAMQVKFQSGEDSIPWASATTSLKAVKLRLQASDEFRKSTPDSTVKATKLLLLAEKEDPAYAEAMILRAINSLVAARFSFVKDRDAALAKAMEITDRAIKAKPDFAGALALDGFLDLWRGKHASAIKKTERAARQLPNSSLVQEMLGNVYLYAGRPNDALEPLTRAGRLYARFLPGQAWHKMLALGNAGRYSEVLEYIDWYTKKYRAVPSSLTYRAIALAGLGREAEAKTAVQELLKKYPKITSRRMFAPMYQPYANDLAFKKYAPILAKLGLPERSGPALPDKPSIAVLPFQNMSDDPAQAYFADGMAEDIITDLSKLSGLFVIARNSSFKYRGDSVDVKKVGRELGVRYVLEGSVRRAGDKLRITAQLIDTKSGGHLWAERYTGGADDVFRLQDAITAKIVRALSVTLSSGEQVLAEQLETTVPEAYDAFLAGWRHFQLRTVEDYRKALVWLNKAVALDPEYGRAWAALASLYHEASERAWTRQLDIDAARIQPLLAKALQLPTALAHRLEAELLLKRGKLFDAELALDKASALDPNDPETHVIRSLLVAIQDDTDAAIALVKTAMRLDPHYPAFDLYILGTHYLRAGDFAKAIELLERSQSRNPEDWYPLIYLAAAQAHAGRLDNAARTAKALVQHRKELGFFTTLSGSFTGFFLPNSRFGGEIQDGLRKAGIPDKIDMANPGLPPEDRLTEVELRELWKSGGTRKGRVLGGVWRHDRDADGNTRIYWNGQPRSTGTFEIRGDIIYRKRQDGRETWCATYRNPKGAKKDLTEFISVCNHGIFYNAIFPLPKAEQ